MPADWRAEAAATAASSSCEGLPSSIGPIPQRVYRPHHRSARLSARDYRSIAVCPPLLFALFGVPLLETKMFCVCEAQASLGRCCRPPSLCPASLLANAKFNSQGFVCFFVQTSLSFRPCQGVAVRIFLSGTPFLEEHL